MTLVTDSMRVPGYHYHRCSCGAPPYRTLEPDTDLCGMRMFMPGKPVQRCTEPPRLLRIVRNEEKP